MLQRFRRRPRGDRGAVAVEAALVTPLILLIVFGIIEFTLLLKDNVAVSSAVRAGARTASAEPRNAAFLDDTAAQMDRAVASLSKDGLAPTAGSELWIYKANAAGFPGSATEATVGGCGAAQCVLYTYDAGAKKFITNAAQKAKWPATSINACPKNAANNPSGPDSVGVYLSYRHSFITGLFGPGLTLADHAVLNFEPVAGTCK
ncbi:MAG TPA: TadE family protein [Candidatus Limnocylindria bacterium]|nr:TadE family protein [Candidatus Limnocylindria bacterium]